MSATILTFCVILLLESILSIDNAAVLAVVVNKSLSDPKERKKAMTYGIVGAYLFRGLSLLCVGWIIYNPVFGIWAKILGGIYLLKLVYDYFWGDDGSEPNTGWAQKMAAVLGLNIFWQTVVAVEFLDMAFSIDNLLAVVSMTQNMVVIVIAVFLGILAMRFVAQYFSVLMEKFPKLETTAFIVIFLLSIKLILSGLADWLPSISYIKELMSTHTFDLAFSACTMVIFFFPLLSPNKDLVPKD
jgi:YkoY family integral membrane protein